MGLPLALLVAVGLALSSPGAAELQRGERRRESQGGPEERLFLGVVTLPAQTLGCTTGVRGRAHQALQTSSARKEGGRVVLGPRRPFDGELLARACVPGL